MMTFVCPDEAEPVLGAMRVLWSAARPLTAALIIHAHQQTGQWSAVTKCCMSRPKTSSVATRSASYGDAATATAPLQGRCAAMLFFKHQLAVLPAMPASGDAFEDILVRELVTDGANGARPGDDGEPSADAGPAVALGNSYVEDLSKLGIGEVLFCAACCLTTPEVPSWLAVWQRHGGTLCYTLPFEG